MLRIAGLTISILFMIVAGVVFALGYINTAIWILLLSVWMRVAAADTPDD